MAKGNMRQPKREPSSGHTWHRAIPQAHSDAEVFSLVHNSDYVPPTPKPASQSRPFEEPTAPLKSRIALGYLTVNGREEPVFAPIQGFEHLFAHADVAAPWPQQSEETQAADTTTATNTTHGPSSAAPSKKPRSRKRRRPRSQSRDDAHVADDDCEATQVPKTFMIGDVNSLQAFYAARFRELTMKPMRDVVTAWVKRLEPKRQKKYGPYQRYDLDPDSNKVKSVKPPWWPANIPYVEPSHLKLAHLVPLAADIMLVHRLVDEQVGKRRYPSWIDQLKTDAFYLISSKDTEHFSSSRGTKYNEAMKKRALEIILPSIFDVAKSHEDYIAQYDLYEGSGNVDPGCGKHVSWQATPRPDRGLVYKRRCRHTEIEPLSDNEGDLTEVDEEAFGPSSTYSSFQSNEEASGLNSMLPSLDSTLSPPGSAFNYPEDVKMFPEDVSKDPSPVPEQRSSQSLNQTLTRASDGDMVSMADRSVDRLHLYEKYPKPHSAFGMNPHAIDLISQRSTGLPYTYPDYSQMARPIFPIHGPNDFATCAPVMPHNIATASALGPHGLPDSCQLHGSSMHQLSPHGLPTQGMPIPMDWINQV